jgi:hypothetical protein
MREFLLIGLFTTASLLVCGCANDEEKDDVDKPSATGELFITTLPSGGGNPTEDPTLTGTPASIRLLGSTDSLPYKAAETYSVLIFDADGKWVNSDQDVSITFTSATQSLRFVSGVTDQELTTITVPKGQPSVLIKLRGDAVGAQAFEVSFTNAAGSGFSAAGAVNVELHPVTTVINNGSVLTAGACSAMNLRAQTAKGSAGIFAVDSGTVLSAVSAGCGIFSDPSCQQPATEVSFSADSSDALLYVNSQTQIAFFDLTLSGTALAARVSCGI